ncbi:candidapepsin-4 precursor [Niveomyces insectorum RCEF 264]|uniref:Candidapepsin-4 n=1 Tax=Niveomyces insectorum RCEF 264 TaxID=1081102 RepID=A0A167WCJ1_9HYPO|nr:candidapepsin-4 precursor [Niveomyces insectorum RCEF 264]
MAPFRLLRLSVLFGAAVAGAATTAAAAAPPLVEDMHDGCIHMQIIHSTNTAHFSKRAVELSLANRTDVAYYAKLNFGTPPQPQYVQLDTGSFELWINPSCAGLSTGDAAFCNAVGAFDPAASSTFASLGTGKQLRYGIGTANITYVLDDIALPGTTSVLQQVQFGVATTTSDEFSGILGIGYGEGLTTRYPNFVDALALQNVTRVKAFTLALGSKDEQEGVIVFGGVDTSKFAGRLARLPITPAASSPDGVPRYWVNLTSVALTAPGSSSSSTSSKTYPNSALQVFLDSGSTLTLLPTALADAIAADFGAAAGGNANGFYTVDCSLAGRPGSLDFAFAGATVRVPYHELIRRSGNTCMLGIQGSADFVLLGDTFLRSAYVVIDQTDNAVWLAQYVNCGSTPAALASAASLTTLTGACTAADSLDMSSSTSSTASSSSSSSGSSSSSSSSPGGGSPASPPPAPSTGAGGQPSSAATPGGGNGASAANGGSTSSAAVRRPTLGKTLVLAVLAGPLMLGLFV